MRMRSVLFVVLLVSVWIGAVGCGHVQTLSTPNPVTVQDFGCGGDVPSPYPPYCRPAHP